MSGFASAGEASDVIQSSGWDMLYVRPTAGSVSTGSITFSIAATDAAGATDAPFPEDPGFHAKAVVQAGTVTFKTGYLLLVPAYLKVIADGPATTPVTLELVFKRYASARG